MYTTRGGAHPRYCAVDGQAYHDAILLPHRRGGWPLPRSLQGQFWSVVSAYATRAEAAHSFASGFR
jgi:hypothetical protein